MTLGAAKFDVVVTGGAGFSVFELTTRIRSISVVAPSQSTVYEFDILDIDGAGRMGSYGLAPGHNTVDGEWICIEKNTFRILNSTEDGVFRITLYHDR